MVFSESKARMVTAGHETRVCDMCAQERARWYCAADEAYLCEKCDNVVHSANAVARRHERVRLGSSGAPVKLKRSHGQHGKRAVEDNSPPSLNQRWSPQLSKGMDMHKWCSSTKKRSRTPRKFSVSTGQSMFVVIPTSDQGTSHKTSPKADKDDTLLLCDLLTPEDQKCDHSATAPLDIKVEPFSPTSTLAPRECHEIKVEETDFTHGVSTYEPCLQDLMTVGPGELLEKIMPSSPSLCEASCNSGESTSLQSGPLGHEPYRDSNCVGPMNKARIFESGSDPPGVDDMADDSTVEPNGSLLLSEDSDIDTFDVMDLCSSANFDNMEMNDLQEGFPDVDMWKDSPTGAEAGSCDSMFEGNPFTGENKLSTGCVNVERQWPQKPVFQKPLSLRLDYEDVITAWLDRGSLWMDGQRPQIVPDINLLDHGFGTVVVGETIFSSTMCSQAGQVPSMIVTDRAREARVLRYKEKRRTRLFSKKIRYEVRKLNAERRPRMKGRFVKRSAIAAIAMAAL